MDSAEAYMGFFNHKNANFTFKDCLPCTEHQLIFCKWSLLIHTNPNCLNRCFENNKGINILQKNGGSGQWVQSMIYAFVHRSWASLMSCMVRKGLSDEGAIGGELSKKRCATWRTALFHSGGFGLWPLCSWSSGVCDHSIYDVVRCKCYASTSFLYFFIKYTLPHVT